MRLLDPDLLDLARQLSPSIHVVALLVGLFLWWFGAVSHRFWMSMAVTVAAGVIGLFMGADFGVQPLVAALLLALSAGMLALSLARLTLFMAGGLAMVLLLRATGLEWNALVSFVVGGLLGVLLYRMWVMMVSALVGTLLVSYSILSLLDVLKRVDAVDFATKNGPLLNWGLALAVVMGVVAQFVLERRAIAKKSGAKPKPKRKKEEPAPAPAPAPPPPAPEPAKWYEVGRWFGRAA